VSSRGIAPANAVIEQLTTSQCRLRTVVFFDMGDVIEFTFAAPSHEPIFVRGSVASREMRGPRFVYTMYLNRMSAKELDALARVAAGHHRREAAARLDSDRRPNTENLTRSTLRVLAGFDLSYRTPRLDFKAAKAVDVSIDGMMMSCSEALVPGEPVEVKFTLPSEVLRAYPEETVVLDLRRAVTIPLRNSRRRRFEEMTLGARVVSNQELKAGRFAYGLAFTCIDGHQREELARYVNAVQLLRNRH
jgi:hypothetical protein